MIDANETFGGTWPFAPRYFEGNGFRMHYIDEAKAIPLFAFMVNRHGVTFIVAVFRLSHKLIGSSCPTIWASEKARLRVTASIPSDLMWKI
jgi:hypothetical protein